MTSQVEFFCSEREERIVLEHLERDGALFARTTGPPLAWHPLAALDPPPFEAPWFLFVRIPAHGEALWHTTRPDLDETSHGSFVASVLARRTWDEEVPRPPLPDYERSPLMIFKRLGLHDGRRTPDSLLAPQSNPERAGADYARWVRSVLGWVRRRGEIVHDWRRPTTTIHNPLGILNTVRAWPDASSELRARPEHFVIWSD